MSCWKTLICWAFAVDVAAVGCVVDVDAVVVVDVDVVVVGVVVVVVVEIVVWKEKTMA